MALTGTSNNVTLGMTYTPAPQLYQRTISNSAYAFSAPSASVTYSPNGLNQYDSVNSTSYSYDGRGNLTSDGSRSFSYDQENHLTGVSGSASASLSYDPTDRMLQQTVSSNTEQYLYDGDSLIAEYDGSGNILRRYVPGQETDETLVWYEGSGLSTRNWLHTDQQGSVIATSDGSGTVTVHTYSASGEPSGGWGSNPPTPIFRYTGQAALAAVALYYYKARMYDPALGRFLQTDPAGYDGGLNLYAYASNDPANASDPSGLDGCTPGIECVTVTGTYTGGGFGGVSGPGPAFSGGSDSGDASAPTNTPPKGIPKPTGTNECSVPPAPPGVSVDRNIQRAEQDSANAAASIPEYDPRTAYYTELIRLFSAGREMDYKSGGHPEFRDFGNFNYGAFGSALGLTPYELHSGAGVQQLRDQRWQPNYGIPFLVSPFGDNGPDYNEIDRGIHYYEACRKSG